MTVSHPQAPQGLRPGSLNGFDFETPRAAAACVIRHLAYAAGELAGRPGLDPADLARYREAEAAYRSLADAQWGRADGSGDGHKPRPPAMGDGRGPAVPLTDLLAHAWERHGRRLPGRAIDPEMVEAASQLLQELRWYRPS